MVKCIKVEDTAQKPVLVIAITVFAVLHSKGSNSKMLRGLNW
jgi:hypothetical protein